MYVRFCTTSADTDELWWKSWSFCLWGLLCGNLQSLFLLEMSWNSTRENLSRPPGFNFQSSLPFSNGSHFQKAPCGLYINTDPPPPHTHTCTTIKSQLVFIFLQGNAWVHSLTLVKWQTWQAAQEAKLPEELEFIALDLSCHETNKQIDAVTLWHIWQHR